jgi:hypothetical protein
MIVDSSLPSADRRHGAGDASLAFLPSWKRAYDRHSIYTEDSPSWRSAPWERAQGASSAMHTSLASVARRIMRRDAIGFRWGGDDARLRGGQSSRRADVRNGETGRCSWSIAADIGGLPCAFASPAQVDDTGAIHPSARRVANTVPGLRRRADGRCDGRMAVRPTRMLSMIDAARKGSSPHPMATSAEVLPPPGERPDRVGWPGNVRTVLRGTIGNAFRAGPAMLRDLWTPVTGNRSCRVPHGARRGAGSVASWRMTASRHGWISSDSSVAAALRGTMRSGSQIRAVARSSSSCGPPVDCR